MNAVLVATVFVASSIGIGFVLRTSREGPQAARTATHNVIVSVAALVAAAAVAVGVELLPEEEGGLSTDWASRLIMASELVLVAVSVWLIRRRSQPAAVLRQARIGAQLTFLLAALLVITYVAPSYADARDLSLWTASSGGLLMSLIVLLEWTVGRRYRYLLYASLIFVGVFAATYLSVHWGEGLVF